MGRVEGKVAFITGAARGQGRSHAIRLAEEGADIIAIDICEQIDTVPFPMGTEEDLAQTVKEVEALDRRIVARKADVRDFTGLKAALDEGVAQLGRLDIVAANAGISEEGTPTVDLDEQSWQNTIDVNLKGVWHTCKAAIPHIRAGNEGGSIILTSSGAGLKGMANIAAYVSAKHGVTGLMRTLANELAPDRIRVNSVHPGVVNTPMVQNDAIYKLFRPDLEQPTKDDALDVFTSLHALPVPWLEPVDISNAVLWLASDEARYVTGVPLSVDAGYFVK
jgi:(+)-trans-carveol dehydrogenase